MSISMETYERVALEDSDGHWELVCGRLREKPGMTAEHNDVMTNVGLELAAQVDRRQYRVRINAGRTQTATTASIPDVMVILTPLFEQMRQERPRGLEMYTEALPLVVEVWSPSTGRRNRTQKLRSYQERGDREIWLLHPYERRLRAWRRQPDGSYTETLFTGATTVEPVAPPGVRVELARLFD
jgi:Uma2 family endonuclease